MTPLLYADDTSRDTLWPQVTETSPPVVRARASVRTTPERAEEPGPEDDRGPVAARGMAVVTRTATARPHRVIRPTDGNVPERIKA